MGLGTQMGARNMDRRGGSQSMSLAGMWWRVARRPSRMVGLSWVSVVQAGSGGERWAPGRVGEGGYFGWGMRMCVPEAAAVAGVT